MLHSVKSKLLSKRLSKDQENRLKQACSTAVNGLQMTLTIAKDVTGLSGVPGLQGGISSLLVVIDAVKQTAQNAEDVEKLAKQIEGLNTFLSSANIGRTVSPAVAQRIGHLANSLSNAAEEMKAMVSRGLMKRLLHHGDDRDSISGHIKAITWTIQSFMVETTLAIEFALDEHANRIQENIDRLHETTRSGFQNINARLDAKDGNPPHALFAAFDCNADRTRCCPGTREDVLDQIFHWIDTGNAPDDAPDSATDTRIDCRIFWINGSIGTGKTTISFTVAEECRRRGILGASFFCSRDDAECSNPGLIFTTIAYQLSIFNPSFKAEISRVVASNPGIGYASIPYQLEQLLVNPLRSLMGSIPSCVVVVDALDECRESETTSLILSSLSRYVKELFPVKFLVTSRPESHITTTFNEMELRSASQTLILHEVQLAVVESDIACYLSTKLALTRVARGIQRGWPTMEDICKLARLSHGLFIFAATSVRFIEDRNYVDARGQLDTLLLNIPPENEDSSPHFHLYRLYAQVLDRAFPAITFSTSGRLKMVLGSITLIHQPLSAFALEHLLGLESFTVRETLMNLHSVVIVPGDDSRTIRLLHPSFFDFITSPLRCRNPKFVVNPEIQHTLMARACFRVMKGLKQDICGIENPSILNNEVDDLSTRIKSTISPHMQYACCHWASHLASALFSDVLVDLVKDFCAERILNWLEVCGLLGELRNALISLNSAQQTISKSGWNIPDTLNFLRDCERFTLEFFPIISSCSLQLYHSALLFTPKQALIRKSYGKSVHCKLKIYNAPDETWNPCLRAMEGHTSCVNSVAFSPDGTRIVSGSKDRTLRLWDAVSGAHLAILSEYSDLVTSVAFSPDSARIVFGSDYGTLRLWDAVTGAHLVTLWKHSNCVNSVTFSPDGAHIVSGSNDCSLRLWNAVSGKHLATLIGHSDWVTCVAFSPDGTRIVSGCRDKTLRLWDAVTREYLATLSGHANCINTVAFSPDGTRIVSGSDDCSLRLWNAVSGTHLATVIGHSSRVTCATFSPDGTRIVSGSWDHTLRLWDTVDCRHLDTLSGHSDRITSVAFSPDGTRFVSGSNDRTLRLWDAVSGAHSAVGRHSKRVTSVAFSPDSTRIVSGSNDKALHLWDAVSGAHLTSLRQHSYSVRSVSFSPDGTRIVSGSGDKTLHLWDPVTGAHLNTLSGHSDRVTSVAFSLDGTRIVSGSDDRTLRLWDAVSGAHLAIVSEHSDRITSVAFSPDGARIVSGSRDTTLCIWDAVSRLHLDTLHLDTLSGHSSRITSVAFSPDGSRIVSGSDDNTICVWDTASGGHLDTVRGNKMCAPSLARSLSLSWTSFSHSDTIPPGPTRLIFSYLAEDGWIHSIDPNRRICWIPISCRPNALDVTKDRVAFGTTDGRMVILDFKDMDVFFESSRRDLCEP